jgi:hypothetical protein
MKKNRYITVLVLTTLVFSVGILLGVQLTNSRAQQIQSNIQDDVLEMQSLELELSLVREINSSSVCNYINYRLPDIIRKKVELGRKFDIGDISAADAELLKKQYVISLTKYWLFSEVNSRECATGKPSILFFFDDYEQSREQGRILDYLVYRSNESITVFSFNTRWNEPLIRLFILNYNITKTPTLMIDGTKYEGQQSVESISSLLCLKYKLEFCGKT